MTTNWDDLPLKLKVPAVARILELDKDTVYRLIRTHALPHTHYGRAIRIDREELRRGLPPQHTHSSVPAPVPLHPAIPLPSRLRRVQHTQASGGMVATGKHGRR